MATYAQLIQFGPYFKSGQLCTLHVSHYVVGTTTLKDVYVDREKGSTAAQPVVSDANGIVSFYADGLYKFLIEGAIDGVTFTTLYTYDKWAVGDLGSQIGEGVALTAASTLTLGTDGDFFHVTGSTGITALSGTQTHVTLVFDATPTLTHSGNLILQYSANYTTVAGDVIDFVNDGAGVWREESRRPTSGWVRLGTPQASTSGTSIDFTGIPTGVRRITISFSGVSTNGSDPIYVQIGDSGGIEASGYLGAGSVIESAVTTGNATTGFIICTPTGTAAILHGTIMLTLANASTFKWTCSGTMARSDTATMFVFAGAKSTSAELDRVRITTSAGTNTFDAGEINIAYE